MDRMMPPSIASILRREGVSPRCWHELGAALAQLLIDGEPEVIVRTEEVRVEVPILLPVAAPDAGPASLAEIEKAAILHALYRHSWCVIPAAAELGVGKTSIYRKLREWGIRAPRAGGLRII
jgi:transcriptional regulator of acetoin/glycerol metabolism